MNASQNTLRRVLVGCLSCLALWAPAAAAQSVLTLTSDPTAPVGGIVTYQFTVPVPQGSTSSLAVTATLPPGLVFVQGVNFAVSGTATCSGAACALPAPVVGGGHAVVWTFNNIVDNGESSGDHFTWEIDAVVDNVVASVAGAELTTTAATATTTVAGGATNTTSTSADPVRVIEPAMIFTASVVPPASGDATDTFTVKVRMVNSAASANGADANNVVASVALPAGLAGVSGSFSAGTCPSKAEGTVRTANGQAFFGFEPLGTDCTFSFGVQLLGTVNPAQTLTGVVTGTWTSEPGLVTQESTYSSVSNMRTGSTLDSGGSLNDYTSIAPFSINVTPLAITLALDNTSAAVGAPVNYDVVVSIPQGTTQSLTLIDVLPTGVTYVGGSDLSASMNLGNLTCAGAACVTPTPTVNGQVVTWSFGDVVNSGADDTSPETLAFTINTVVANVPEATAGAVLGNSISIQGTEASADAAQSVEILEPALTFSATSSSASTTPQAGDQITTVVTVTNGASETAATAYEATVVYTMPSGYLVPVSADGGSCEFASQSLTSAAASLTLAPIDPGTSCTFTLVTQLTTSVLPAQLYTATFLGTWTSASGPVVGERTGNTNDPGGALNTYSQTGADIAFTTGVPGITFSNGSVTTASVGGQVASHVVVSIPHGSLPPLVVNATLPAGLVFAQGANFAAAGTVTCGGLACTLPAPVVSGGGHAVQWTFNGVVGADLDDAVADTLSWDVVSVVENDASSIAGAQYAPSVSYTIAPGVTNGGSTAPITVTEPKLAFTVASAPAVSSGNDLVTITVTVQNAPAANSATAYDAAVTFGLPAGKLSAVPGGYGQGSCPAATATLSGASASFVFGALPVSAASCTFTWQAQLSTHVNQNEVETATGSATWTSQPGAITSSESAFASDALERTGNSGNIGGALNNYVVNGLGFSVTASTSSFAFTGPLSLTAAVGAPAVYHASTVIPQGSTPELDVVATFPAGLVFKQGTNLVATPGILCGGAACVLPAPVFANAGATNSATWTLRNIVNSNAGDTGSDSISWDVVAIVENVASSTAGATYVASAAFAVGSTTANLSANAVTVVEPKLAMSTSLSTATAQGNDVVTVNVNVVNANIANGANAYNAVATFALPLGKLTPVANGYSAGSCPVATQTLTSAVAQFAFASIPLNTSCAFSFQVRLLTAVTQAEVETTLGSATWTSQPVATPAPQSPFASDSTERTGSTSDTGGALNNYAQSGIGFAITTPVSTFQYTGPASPTAAVGGAVVFHASTTIPRGTTPELDLFVALPTGLAFQKATNLTATSGVFCSGVACTLPVPSVGAGKGGVTVASWVITNITDNNPSSTNVDTLQWDVVAIVENDAAAVAGATFTTSAEFDVGEAIGTFTSAPVTVVEPALTFSTTSAPALAAANDLVTVTVQVVNPTTTNGTAAYDAVATFVLPAGKLIAAPGSYSKGTCPIATPTLSGTNASFNFASIPLGASCTFSFQAQLASSVNPLETETATASATWTSQPGDLTQPQSTYATDSTERTGLATNPGAALNTYSQKGFGFSVSTRGSSFAFTGPAAATAAVGGVAVYHVSAIIPQGTTPALGVTLTLPHGLTYQQGANFAATSGITCGGLACSLPTPTVGAGGYAIQWTLPSIVNANSGDTLSDTISWDVAAVVENSAASIAGATYVANATIAVGANSASFTAQPLTVVEPHVTFTTLGTPANAGANDAVTVLVNLANPAIANGADAYNVTATYTLATGKQTAVPGSYHQGTCPAAAQATLQGTTASFVFNKIAMGSGCQFAFQVRLTTGVLQAEQEVATALGTWTSQSVTGAPAQTTFATDSTERTGDTSNTGGALNSYRQTNFGFTVTVPSSSFMFAGPSTNAAVGGIVLYHAGATIPQATLNSLKLVVTLPTGLVFQKSTDVKISNGISCGGLVCVIPIPTVTNAGRTIEYDFSDIVDSNADDKTDSIEWDVATVVENDSVAVAGAQFVSSAVFTSDLTTQSFTAPPVIVLEPKPVFAIAGTPADAAPLASTLVTVSVSNPLSATGTDAFDTTLSFGLDAGKMVALAGSYQAGSCPTATATLSGTTASFHFDTIPLTTACTFSFGATVDATAAPAATVTATSSATWASQPGTTTPALSTFATDANRRTGNASDPGGALNDYTQSGFDVSVHVPAAYLNGGIGSQGGGCSGAGPSDLAWVGLLFGLAALARKRRGATQA